MTCIEIRIFNIIRLAFNSLFPFVGYSTDLQGHDTVKVSLDFVLDFGYSSLMPPFNVE